MNVTFSVVPAKIRNGAFTGCGKPVENLDRTDILSALKFLQGVRDGQIYGLSVRAVDAKFSEIHAWFKDGAAI